MAAHHAELTITTRARVEVINITSEVTGALRESKVGDGLACVSVRHATCALALNEDEPGLRKDLERVAATILDPVRRARPFLHDEIDDNAQSHLTACLLGSSVTIPLAGGRLRLGTWQCLFLVELDGPRSRRVDLTVVG